jgi:hypothetical protein
MSLPLTTWRQAQLPQAGELHEASHQDACFFGGDFTQGVAAGLSSFASLVLEGRFLDFWGEYAYKLPEHAD